MSLVSPTSFLVRVGGIACRVVTIDCRDSGIYVFTLAAHHPSPLPLAHPFTTVHTRTRTRAQGQYRPRARRPSHRCWGARWITSTSQQSGRRVEMEEALAAEQDAEPNKRAF